MLNQDALHELVIDILAPWQFTGAGEDPQVTQARSELLAMAGRTISREQDAVRDVLDTLAWSLRRLRPGGGVVHPVLEGPGLRLGPPQAHPRRGDQEVLPLHRPQLPPGERP